MKSKLMVLLGLAFVLCTTVTPIAHSQASSAATILALKATLTELQAVIDRAQIGLDSIAAAKIEAASNEAQRLLREIEKIRKGTVKDVNEAVQEVATQTHQLASSLRKTISQTERRAFLDVNTALANASESLDGIPLVKIAPYAAAIDPPRIRSDVSNRRVLVYGYFPDSKDGRSPEAVVGGSTVQLSRETGAKLSFDLPRDLALKEEQFVDIQSNVPTRTGWLSLWKGMESFKDRIYVERSLPLSCNVQVLEANPALDEIVRASSEFTDEARTMGGGGKPSNIRTVSSKDLLIATVPSAVDLYDITNVRIQTLGERFWGGAACSDHGNWSGKLRRWDPESVEFELSAPSVAPHMHSGMRDDCGFVSNVLGAVVGQRCIQVPYTYLHGGGGSHANIGLKPTFVVRKKGVDPFVKKTPVTLSVGYQATEKHEIKFQQTGWQLNLLCSFKDGDEKWDTGPINLSPQLQKAVSKGVAASYDNGVLFVGAH